MYDQSNPTHTQRDNRILAALPREDFARITAHLELVKLSQGQLLCQTGQHIEYVYFPTNALVSFVSQMSDGISVEVGVTGSEGMVGLPVLLGGDRAPHEMVVQIPGGALRTSAEVIKGEFKRGGALHDLLLRYTRAFLLTTCQVAACNRVHSIGERLARWLLMTYDRCLSEDLPLTQDFIAMMLGTHRPGVTAAAAILQTEGLIKYRRGHITIEDKEGLKDFACECYGIIKADFDRLPS